MYSCRSLREKFERRTAAHCRSSLFENVARTKLANSLQASSPVTKEGMVSTKSDLAERSSASLACVMEIAKGEFADSGPVVNLVWSDWLNTSLKEAGTT